MGSLSAANEAKAAAFAHELGEAILARPDIEHVHTMVLDLGAQIGVLVRRGGRDLVFRILLPTVTGDDGVFEVAL